MEYLWVFTRNCSSNEDTHKHVGLVSNLSIIHIVQFVWVLPCWAQFPWKLKRKTCSSCHRIQLRTYLGYCNCPYHFSPAHLRSLGNSMECTHILGWVLAWSYKQWNIHRCVFALNFIRSTHKGSTIFKVSCLLLGLRRLCQHNFRNDRKFLEAGNKRWKTGE